jgi:hypothetical protein
MAEALLSNEILARGPIAVACHDILRRQQSRVEEDTLWQSTTQHAREHLVEVLVEAGWDSTLVENPG